MTIEVLKRGVFEKNDRAAEENQDLLARHRVVAVNIMGGAGCGKTTLLECVLPQLLPRRKVAVLEGDLATTRDAERIAALGVPTIQLLTEGGCHLTATLVSQGLQRLPLAELDMVIIENVGNPICPANFNLGEHHRVAVLSVTEGDDKPAKYPYLFRVADAVVITKQDILPATNFDLEEARRLLHTLSPNVPVFTTSRKEAASFGPFAEWLRGLAG